MGITLLIVIIFALICIVGTTGSAFKQGRHDVLDEMLSSGDIDYKQYNKYRE